MLDRYRAQVGRVRAHHRDGDQRRSDGDGGEPRLGCLQVVLDRHQLAVRLLLLRKQLRALRIVYDRLDERSSVAHRIAEAQTLAYSSNKPVALLMCRDLMWEP